MTGFAAVLAHPSLRTLLAGAIDYAGLFPPAQLDMPTVVANYRSYLEGSDSWSLGRLIVPVARLDELAQVMTSARRTVSSGNDVLWRVSALVGSDVRSDSARVAAFNSAMARHVVIDAVESRATTPDDVQALAGLVMSGQHFVEVPLTIDLAPMLAAIRRVGGCAKMRTGGVTLDAFPLPRDVAVFLRACADAGVPFKATAGLHHPLRGEYPLTYEARSAYGTMYGYLNVLLAAVQALRGEPLEVLVTTLETRSGAKLAIDDEEIRWETGQASLAEIAEVRRTFALAFGSCSFREPLDDLGTLLAA